MSWMEFITNGVEVFNGGIEDLDSFDKKLQFLYITNMLNDLQNNNLINHILYKDCTASAIQLLAVALKPKNQEVLEACNLQSETY